MKQIGNVKSNSIYNPNETRHPPPINAVDQERDSELEKFIRCEYRATFMDKRSTLLIIIAPAKYEFKQYFDRSALVASKLGPSRSASNRLASSPSDAKLGSSATASALSTSSSVTSTSIPLRQDKPVPPPPAPAPTPAVSATPTSFARAPVRSVSQPIPPPLNLPPLGQAATPATNGGAAFNDLAGLRAPASSASLPLQYASPQYSAISINSQMSIPTIPTASSMSMPTSSPMTIPSTTSSTSFLTTSSPYGNLSASSHSPLPSSLGQTTGISPAVAGRSMSLGTGLTAQMGGMSFAAGGMSPFQQTQMLPGASPAPSPNPYAPQLLSQVTGIGAGYPAPYNTTGQQMSFVQPMQQPMQMIAPQPQLQSLQVPGQVAYMPSTTPQGSPFAAAQFATTTPSPYAMTQPLPYTGQPSPFAATQPLPQMQQQPQANPFTSWIQTGPQQAGAGYPGQQQWGGM